MRLEDARQALFVPCLLFLKPRASRLKPSNGAEGIRTLTCPLKRRKRCRYATTPKCGRGYPFQTRGHVLFSCSSVHLLHSPAGELSAVELNHLRRRIRSPCFRYNTGQSYALPRFAQKNTVVIPLARKVGREAFESSSPDLQPGAKPSQLPAHRCCLALRERNKKARRLVTPGFGSQRAAIAAQRHKRK